MNQSRQRVTIACGESSTVELGVEGSEEFSADTALLNELQLRDQKANFQGEREYFIHLDSCE